MRETVGTPLRGFAHPTQDRGGVKTSPVEKAKRAAVTAARLFLGLRIA